MNYVNEIICWFYGHTNLPRMSTSLTYYLPNSSFDAASNIIISYNNKYHCLLKKWKKSEVHERAMDNYNKVSILLSLIENDALYRKIIQPFNIAIGSQTFLYQEFIDSKTAYNSARMLKTNTSKNSALTYLFDFTKKITSHGHLNKGFYEKKGVFVLGESLIIAEMEKSPNYSAFPNWANSTIPLNNESSSFGLVHFDLAPSNILTRDNDYFIIDWEFASVSYSIFNIFDFILHLGSFLTTPFYKHRSSVSYLEVFKKHKSKEYEFFFQRIKKLMAEHGSLELPIIEIEKLFKLYLISKSTCQFRAYGVQSAFDNSWMLIANNYMNYYDDFYLFWEKVFDMDDA